MCYETFNNIIDRLSTMLSTITLLLMEWNLD